MRRFGIIMVALMAMGCGGGTTPEESAARTVLPTQPKSEAALLPNTLWNIVTIDGQPAPADPPTKVSFGLPEAFNGLQVSGLCKTLFGTWKLKGATLAPALELGEPGADCDADGAAYRQLVMEAINGATAWAMPEDRSTLTLTGAKTLVMERT